MKATTAALPSGAGWVYELKWDGMRAIVESTAGSVRLWSANGKEATMSFPELAELGGTLAHLDVVLDGEIVALDPAGNPSFERLQHRMHVVSPTDAARRAETVPVALVLFDVLRVGEHDTTGLPWRDRRTLLESLADELPAGVELARVYDDGPALLEAARQQGLEGVMAKRADAPYAVGRRSPSWVKVKVVRRQELVIGGWADGQGNREGRLGALLVGHYERDATADPADPPLLRYAGRVGTGFSDEALDLLGRKLAPLAITTCPFTPGPPRERTWDAHWVRPELVAEIGYGNWTGEGILRHPVYFGLRTDVDPLRVVREP
ncbi:MAG TPA: non-homologous end-joining DNA ligase [Acidimicrobiales bacterium]|jgi:bifunctional non-homologous end joining protein LigD